jgi:hypothetical protein
MAELSEEVMDDAMHADLAVVQAAIDYILTHPLEEGDEECGMLADLRDAVERTLFVQDVLTDLEGVE